LSPSSSPDLSPDVGLDVLDVELRDEDDENDDRRPGRPLPLLRLSSSPLLLRREPPKGLLLLLLLRLPKAERRSLELDDELRPLDDEERESLLLP